MKAGRGVIRCAIYTRKSSEEGLEQDFNSLDAQREACAAYILSQTSEGWAEVDTRYDDGGISGGTLERPGLKALLADVAAGQIDIIVVYKVDRLTRSLLDFSKLVEAFDAAGVSFVSVTQSFNTTTSMGRLTLNMLLSFAQFEREVTAERIRDKIAASKAKGMWMGGTPPLGYRPDGRSLAIVEDHAAIVRSIFALYLELGNVRQVAERLKGERISLPVRTTTTGNRIGGGAFTCGQLYHILKSRTYLGEIDHKGTVYPGLHAAIIERKLWDAVQARLTDNVRGYRSGERVRSPALLAGRIKDGKGRALVSSHATKTDSNKGTVRRYRYYTLASETGDTPEPGLRLPAREIEKAVATCLADAFADPLTLASSLHLDAQGIAPIDRAAPPLVARLRTGEHAPIRAILSDVTIHPDHIALRCHSMAIAQLLGLSIPSTAPDTLMFTHHLRLTRTGRAMRLVMADGGALTTDKDTALPQLVARAHRYWVVLRNEPIDIKGLAAREGVSASWISRVLRLAFLSPEVTAAILDGRHRSHVDGALLLATDAIDPLWSRQREALLRGRGNVQVRVRP